MRECTVCEPPHTVRHAQHPTPRESSRSNLSGPHGGIEPRGKAGHSKERGRDQIHRQGDNVLVTLCYLDSLGGDYERSRKRSQTRWLLWLLVRVEAAQPKAQAGKQTLQGDVVIAHEAPQQGSDPCGRQG